MKLNLMYRRQYALQAVAAILHLPGGWSDLEDDFIDKVRR
jgi:hypothetical protein